jgi:putative membrane protein
MGYNVSMFLTPAEAASVEACVARLEARTGAQIVTSVVGKSDTYAELPWTAFALGASLAACGVVATDAWQPDWVTSQTALVHAVLILGVGAAAALLTVFLPPVGRLFLRASRRDVEVRQYAESLFLRRELFRTASRTGVLVLISLFERRIEILPDVGLRPHVREEEWHAVIVRMVAALERGRPAHALLEGLAAIESLLVAKGMATNEPGTNELPNQTIEEVGA